MNKNEMGFFWRSDYRGQIQGQTSEYLTNWIARHRADYEYDQETGSVNRYIAVGIMRVELKRRENKAYAS